MRFHRLALKDWIVNLYLRARFAYIRRFRPHWLSNKSKLIKDGYTLTFNDDFDEVSWNRYDPNKKWDKGEPWGPFHPGWANKYFGLPKLGENSCAVFYTKYEPHTFELDGKEIEIPYIVSWLNSANTFRQQYGRFECRMTLPKEKGSWPAFWLWGPTHPPEIDVLEAYGRDTGDKIVYQEINFHWRNEQGKHRNVRPWRIKIDDYDEGIESRFHEFVVEWTHSGMYFYTDGILVFQYTNQRILELTFGHPEVKPFMLVNQNIMKMIDGSEGADYYSEFRVDYVRAYQMM
jgi:hypothetical protein